MFKTISQGASLWQFEGLADSPAIRHFVTGREGGKSENHLSGLNLSFSVGDSEENVFANRTMLANALNISGEQLYFVSQYHSDVILNVTEIYDGNPQKADAIVTNKKEICICTMAADCVPILAFDPVEKVIAAIHAGWRGTAASITLKTLQRMSDLYKSKPENIMLAIGPSISQGNYEVGKDVYESFTEQQGVDSARYFVYNSFKDKYFLNLWEANKDQALTLGLPERNIELAGICTFANPDQFYSARYFKNKTGRFAAGIMLV